jgi:hypothetical protein
VLCARHVHRLRRSLKQRAQAATTAAASSSSSRQQAAVERRQSGESITNYGCGRVRERAAVQRFYYSTIPVVFSIYYQPVLLIPQYSTVLVLPVVQEALSPVLNTKPVLYQY